MEHHEIQRDVPVYEPPALVGVGDFAELTLGPAHWDGADYADFRV